MVRGSAEFRGVFINTWQPAECYELSYPSVLGLTCEDLFCGFIFLETMNDMLLLL